MRVDDSKGNERAGHRLQRADMKICEAFESLDIGFTYDDVWDYLLGAPAFLALDDQQGFVAGMVMGFAIVAVEQQRWISERGERILRGR